MQRYLKCSWTPVGKDNCPDYAIKEETRLEGPLQFGIKPKQGGDRKSRKWNAKELRDFNGDLSELLPYEAKMRKQLKQMYPENPIHDG